MSTNKSESKLKKNMFPLFILVASGSLIYGLPYFKGIYYDTFAKYFGLSNTQMGSLGTIYGGLSIVAFFFGGFLADLYSARKLVSISLISTGALGFILLLYPPYPVVLLIHALWGITAILTFWSALIKAIRELANPDEQSKAFGLMEGGRGIVNIIHTGAVLAMFSFVSKKVSDKLGLSCIIFTYSAICVVLGILVLFLLKENEYEKNVLAKKEKKELVNVPVLKKVLKMPETWLVSIIIFTSYAMLINYYYITPYSTKLFGASAVLAAAFSIFSQWCRPIGCAINGFLGDRIGSSKVMAYTYLVMIAGILGVTFTPAKQGFLFALIAFCAAIYCTMYGIQTLHYAILEEADYPNEITGTATAIIAPLGYSSEFFTPILAGYLLDRFPGLLGYRLFFGFLAFLGVIGFIATLIWMRLTREKRAIIYGKARAK